MQRVQVESSDIVSVGYSAGTLEVEFRSGRVYQYLEVEPSVYQQFLTAESLGRYFNTHINNRYRYKHVKASAAKQHSAVACIIEESASWEALQTACHNTGVIVERLDPPTLLEVVQSHDSQHVALQKATAAHRLLARPVITQTFFWNIVALRGFPGAFASYVSQWLRPSELLRLMSESRDRSVVITKTVCYCDGDRRKLFSEDIVGTIAETPSLNAGDTLESLTVMAGQHSTVTALKASGQASPLQIAGGAYKELARWLKMQQSLGRF